MIAKADRKKVRKKRKKAVEKVVMPEFKPEWINAFLIILLYKVGGIQALTMDQLKKFDEIEEGKQPEFLYDKELDAFILKSPHQDDEEPPLVIELPEKKIITNLKEVQNGKG